jgi:hypothetical protein
MKLFQVYIKLLIIIAYTPAAKNVTSVRIHSIVWRMVINFGYVIPTSLKNFVSQHMHMLKSTTTVTTCEACNTIV